MPRSVSRSRSRSRSRSGSPRRSRSRSRSGKRERDFRGHQNDSPKASRSRSRSPPRTRVQSGSRDPRDCEFDSSARGYRLYVCDFQDPSTSEIERAFEKFGTLSESPFVAKSARPCFGFISYKHKDVSNQQYKSSNFQELIPHEFNCRTVQLFERKSSQSQEIFQRDCFVI